MKDLQPREIYRCYGRRAERGVADAVDSVDKCGYEGRDDASTERVEAVGVVKVEPLRDSDGGQARDEKRAGKHCDGTSGMGAIWCVGRSVLREGFEKGCV